MKENSLLVYLQKIFCLLGLFFLISPASYALVFSVIPKSGTTLPTSVEVGGTVTAYYTVYNNTISQRNNNFVKYLPANVSQVTSGGTYPDTCGATFSLAPNGRTGYSCTLQLTISGPVSAGSVIASNNLFVCFPGGKTCAGTNYPLNVVQTPQIILTSIAVTPSSSTISVAGTQQYVATGTYSDNSTQNITSTATWASSIPGVATISSSGLATGVSAGTTDITAALNSITSNLSPLTVTIPVTATLTTPTENATGVSVSTSVVVTFSGAVQPATVTTSSFRINDGTSDLPGNIVMSNGNTVATYTPTSNLPLNTKIFVIVNSSILSAAGDAITPSTFDFDTQRGYLIYLSSSGLASNANLGGVTGADAICQSDSQCPAGSTCLAMLVGTNGGYTRAASPSTINWVLQPSTLYINASDKNIGTTTVNAIFNFPLENSLGTSAQNAWTGLNTNWTTSGSNCLSWTVTGGGGAVGLGNALTTSAINSTLVACSSVSRLYCVQQP